LKLNFIKYLKFFINSLVLFIKKKNKGLYFYINYKDFNIIIIRNKYLIPLISEILDRLYRVKIYTKIDLKGVYNLIKIKERNE